MKKKVLDMLVVFLLMVALTGCSGGSEHSNIDAESGVSALASLADRYIEGCVNSIKILAMTTEVKSQDWNQMKDLLTETQEIQIPSLVWFVLPNGSYYTVEMGLTDKNLSDRNYFPVLMAGNDVLGDLVVGKTSGRKSLIAAVPVTNNLEVIGGLGISIFLDSLSELLVEKMSPLSGMVFYAVTGDGEVALHSDIDLILAENPDLSDDVVSVISELTGWKFSLGYK